MKTEILRRRWGRFAAKAGVLAFLFSTLSAPAADFLSGAVTAFPTDWSVSDGSQPESVATKSVSGAELTLAFDLDANQSLTYAPPTASDAGGRADVVISNAVFSTAYDHPGLDAVGGIESQAAICVYTNASSGGPLQYLGWAGGYTGAGTATTNLTWFVLSGATPVEGATNTVTMSFDYRDTPATVTFKVGAQTLNANGVEAIPLSTATNQVTAVSFSGRGSIGELAGETAPNAFAVQFFGEDGSSLFGPTNVPAGDAPVFLGTPNPPAKADTAEYTYAFAGWTNAASAGTVVTLANETIVSPTNYYATFAATPVSYTLSWITDGDEPTGTYTSGQVPFGTTIVPPDTPTKTGYSFDKWTPAPVAGTMPAANTTYTATWNPATDTAYTVKHFQQALDGTYPAQPTDTDNLTGTTGAQTAAAAKSYTGFTAGAVTQTAIDADGSTVVTIQYTRNSYQLTWTTDGDALTGNYTSGMVPFGTTIVQPDQPTKTGSTFAGWSPAVAGTMPAEATTYAATWNAATFTVYWVVDGVTNETDTGVAYNTQASYDGQTPSRDATTTVVYSFSGWSDGSTTYAANALPAVTGNVTFTAQFSESPRPYALAWDANGGVLSGEYTAAGSVANGASITAPTATRDGYAFGGWSPEFTATMPAADTTYVAQWTEIAVPVLALAEPTLDSTTVAGPAGTTVSATIAPSATVTATNANAAVVVDGTTATATFSNLTWNASVDWMLQSTGAADLPGRFYAKGETQWFSTNELADIAGLAEGMKGVDLSASPSPTGQMVRIQTRLEISEGAQTSLPTGEDVGEARTGFAVAQIAENGDEAPAYYAFNGASWDRLFGAAPAEGATNDLLMVLDVEASQARYYVDGVALYATNAVGDPVYAIGMKASDAAVVKGIGFANPEGVAAPVVAEYDVPFVAAVSGTPYTNSAAAVAALVAADKAAANDVTVTLLADGVAGSVALDEGEQVTVAAGAFDPSGLEFTAAGAPTWKPVSSGTAPTLVWTVAPNDFAVVWHDGDGTELGTTSVVYGTVPVYLGATEPSKDATATTNFTFDGWAASAGGPKLDPLPAVTGPTNYYAHFSESAREYTLTVTFTAPEGFAAPETYTNRVANGAAYSYTPPAVTGCTVDPALVSGTMPAEDLTVPVAYSAIDYTITWNYKAADGSDTSDTTTVVWGQTPSHADPAGYVANNTMYAFDAWSPAPAAYDGTTTAYAATYKSTEAKATVITVADNGDGTATTNTVGYYATLADAVAAATNGCTVLLLAGDAATRISVDKDLVIDLGGNAFTGRLTMYDGNVVFTNGTVSGKLDVYDTSVVTVAANTTVNGQVIVWGDGVYGQPGCKTPTFNLYGTIDAGEMTALYNNSRDTSKPNINVFEGAVISSTSDYNAIALREANFTMTGGTIDAPWPVMGTNATITISGGTINAGKRAITAEYGTTVTISGGTINNSGVAAVKADTGSAVTVSGGAINGDDSGIALYAGSTLTMTGGSITAGDFGVYNSGTETIATTMAISGGTITSTNAAACAIYQAGPGSLTLSGTAVVSGADAVEVRAGTVQVQNNAQLIATAPYSAPTSNGGGTTGRGGVALLVSQHASAPTVSATVSGGTLQGEVAFEEATLETNNDPTKVSGTIAGGNIIGDVKSEDVDGLIPSTSTALFSDADAEGVAEGYALKETGEGTGLYAVAKTWTVAFTVDGAAYTNLVVFDGDPVARPADPQKDCYTFREWQTNGVDYAFASPVKADLTLLADWTRNAATVTAPAVANATVSATTNGVAVAGTPGENGATLFAIEAGTPVVVTYAAAEGYHVSGSDPVSATAEIQLAASETAHDLTLADGLPTMVLNAYTVTWENWNGDTLETDGNVPHGTVPTYDGQAPTRPDESGTRYTFDGWTVGGTTYLLSETLPGVVADTTITAHYASEGAVARVLPAGGGDPVSYNSLDAAVAAAGAGDTVQLLGDAGLASTVVVAKDLTIDLNGWDLAATDCRAIWVKAGNVRITGAGTISAEATASAPEGFGASSVVRVGDSAANETAAALVIDTNVVVSSAACYGVTVFGKNNADGNADTADISLDLYGTVSVTSSGDADAAISGQGRSDYLAADITVHDGATVASANSAAIYFPGAGTLTVDGGTVTGKHGIVARAGDVVVNGGAVTATGTGAGEVLGDINEIVVPYAAISYTTSRPDVWQHYASGDKATVNGGTIRSVVAPCVVQIAAEGDAAAVLIPASSTAVFSDADAQGVPVGYALKETSEGSGLYAISQVFTVTYANYDGAALQATTNFVDDATPAYGGETPARAADAQYTYSFDHWSPAPDATVTSNATYTAVFAETVNQYDVIWVADGTQFESNRVDYGAATPVPAANPTRAPDAQYSYSFDHWSPAPGATVTSNATYTAEFVPIVNQYDVIWVADGAQFASNRVDYGASTPVPATNPTKDADAQYSYSFDHWSPAPDGTVSSNATYEAVFSQTVNQYDVIWVADGAQVASNRLEYGASIVAPADPSKNSTDTVGYTFAGWEPAPTATVLSNATYAAAFAETSLAAATWIGGAQGDWNVATNWDIGYVPTKATVVTFTNDAEVAISNTDACKEMVLDDANIALVCDKNATKPILRFYGDGDSAVSVASGKRGSLSVNNLALFNERTDSAVSKIGCGIEILGNVTFRGVNPGNNVSASFTITGKTTISSNAIVETIDYGTTKFQGGVEVAKGVTAKIKTNPNGGAQIGTGVTLVANDGAGAPTAIWLMKKQGNSRGASLDDGAKILVDAAHDGTYYVKNAGSGALDGVRCDIYEATPKPTVVTVAATEGLTVTGVASNQHCVPGTNLVINVSGVPEGYDLSVTIAKHADSSVVLLTTNAASFVYTMPDYDIDVSVTAAIQTFAVAWLDWDGTPLEADGSAEYGTVPSYDGAAPTREPTDDTTFWFDGWTNAAVANPTAAAALPRVVADATYGAHYAESNRLYAIDFRSEDGASSYFSTSLTWHAAVVYDGAEPTKPATPALGFAFAGWTNDVVSDPTAVAQLPAVSGDATYFAAFDATNNLYEVVLVADGAEFCRTNIVYDGFVVYPQHDPVHEEDGKTFLFLGWTNEVVTTPADPAGPVTEAGTWYAAFEEIDAVAKVVYADGYEEYVDTLADAVARAGAGEKAVLLADVSGAGFEIDKAVTVDFGGHAYEITADDDPIWVTAEGAVLTNGVLRSSTSHLLGVSGSATIADFAATNDWADAEWGAIFVSGAATLSGVDVLCEYGPAIVLEPDAAYEGESRLDGSNVAARAVWAPTLYALGPVSFADSTLANDDDEYEMPAVWIEEGGSARFKDVEVTANTGAAIAASGPVVLDGGSCAATNAPNWNAVAMQTAAATLAATNAAVTGTGAYPALYAITFFDLSGCAVTNLGAGAAIAAAGADAVGAIVGTEAVAFDDDALLLTSGAFAAVEDCELWSESGSAVGVYSGAGAFFASSDEEGGRGGYESASDVAVYAEGAGCLVEIDGGRFYSPEGTNPLKALAGSEIEVSGGWFTAEVPEGCLARGYAASPAWPDAAPDRDAPFTVYIYRDIAWADFTVEPVAFVYDGSDHAPAVRAVFTDDEGETETLHVPGDYVMALPEGRVHAGEYAIAIQGTNSWYGTTNLVFAITNRPLSIVALDARKTYGEADPALLFTTNGLVEGDVLEGVLARADGENVGTYAITQGTLRASADYDLSFTEATFAIDPARVAPPAAPASVVYDGTEKVPGIATSPLWNLHDTNGLVNAGVYDVRAELADKDNYTWTDGSTTDLVYRFEIARAEVAPPAAPAGAVYDGEVHYASFAESDLWTVSGNDGWTAAGTHGGIAVALADKTNHVWSDGTDADRAYTFTIAKAPVAKPAAPAGTNYVAATVYADIPASEFYAVSGNVGFLDAGEYPIGVALADPANHSWDDGTTNDLAFTFAIGKAPLVATAQTFEVPLATELADVDFASHVVYEGFLGTDTADDALSEKPEMTATGYTSEADPNDRFPLSFVSTGASDNYEIECVAEDAYLVVEPTPVTLTFDPAGGEDVDLSGMKGLPGVTDAGVNFVTANYMTPLDTTIATTRDGWVFAGWDPALPATMPKRGTNLVARWTEPGAMVISVADAGTGATSTNWCLSLRDAVEAADDGDTIVLLADDRTSFAEGGIVIDKDLVIDGAGFTVYGDSAGPVQNVTAGAQGDDVEFDGVDGSNVHGFFVKSGDVTFRNLALTEFGDSDYVNKFGYTPIQTASAYTGALVLENVDIDKFNRTAVCVRGGTLTMTGGTIVANAANKDVAEGKLNFQQPIEIRGGTALIDGVTVSSTGYPYETNGGGAIVVWSAATLTNVVVDFTGVGVWTDYGSLAVVGGDTSVAATDKALFVEDGGSIAVAAGDFAGELAVDAVAGSSIVVSGGTFDRQVPAGFVDPDLLPTTVADGTGRFTVKPPRTVSFAAGEGESGLPETLTVAQTDPAAEPEQKPSKEGYVFRAWQLGGADYDWSTPVTEDVSLTAAWSPAPYPLVIVYQVPAGVPAPAAYSNDVPYGARYAVASPSVAGCTPSVKVVSGSMPIGGVQKTVVYKGGIGLCTFEIEAAEYDGTPRTPGLVVRDAAGAELVAGIDYSVSVPGSPTDAGNDYPFTVSGLGNWNGSTNLVFDILPAPVGIPVFEPKTYTAALQSPDADPDGIWEIQDAEDGTDVGEYDVTVRLADADNYRWTDGSADPVDLTWSIAPAPLTVTPDALSKTYGAADPALTYTAVGLLGNDAPTGTLVRVAGEEIGTYEILPGTLGAGANYAMSFTEGVLFTIERAEATVMAVAANKTFGEADPAFSATVTGLADGETLQLVYEVVRTEDGEDVGEYAIVPSGDAVQGAYSVNYVASTLTIAPKGVVVTAADDSKVAGNADPPFTASAEGLLNGDTVAWTVARAAGEAAGTYAITPSGDAEQGNYAVTYVPGTFTIVPAAASLTHDGATTNFATVAEAVAAAEDEDTITLQSDFTEAAVAFDKDVRLDLNGKTWTVSSGTNEVTGMVALVDESANGGGSVAGAFAASGADARIVVESGAAVAGDVVADAGAWVVVQGTVSGDVTADDADVAVTGGTVAGAVAAVNGGCVQIGGAGAAVGSVSATGAGSEVGIAGGTVSGTLSETGGGEVAVTGGHFAENPSAFVDPALYAVVGDATAGYDVVRRTGIEGAVVTVAENLTYTGFGREGVLAVVVNGTNLVETAGCTIVYANNTNATTAASLATATIAGTGIWSGETNVTFTIGKATLTATATNVAVEAGTDPAAVPYGVAIAGFVNGEDESVLASLPTATNGTYTAATAPGVYADSIEVSGGAADNYAFEYVAGTLTVVDSTPPAIEPGQGLVAGDPPAIAVGDRSFTVRFRTGKPGVTYELVALEDVGAAESAWLAAPAVSSTATSTAAALEENGELIELTADLGDNPPKALFFKIRARF